MSVVIDHNFPPYRKAWDNSGNNKWNGAFFYSKEIVKNIIPYVKTDRNWLTINSKGECLDHTIVFIHNNKNPENYDWLRDYKDLVLVCGIPETCDKVKHLGTPIYLPLSIDVKEVMKYQSEKIFDCAYVGRRSKLEYRNVLPKKCKIISGMPRTRLLKEMAKYKKVYAVGRCAIEARALGAEIGVCDSRFLDPSIWKVVDNSEAVKILQEELDKIDGKAKK